MTCEEIIALCRQRGATGFDYDENANGEIDWYRLRFAFEETDVPMFSVEPIPVPEPLPVPEPIPVAPVFAAAAPDMADFATDEAMGAIDIGSDPSPAEPPVEPLPFAKIPQAMRAVSRWCVWQKHADGRKIPYCVLPGGFWSRSEQCKSNDPSMWVSFDEALHCFLKSNGHLGGLSFALGDGWWGVDFDDVIVNGVIHPLAKSWLASLGGYQEISQSKQGKKAINHEGVLSDAFLGSAKTGRQFKGIPAKGMATEVYHCGRFFFLTGEGSGEPHSNQAGLNAFCDELLSLKAAMQPKPKAAPRSRSNSRTARSVNARSGAVDTKALDYIDPNDLDYNQWLSVVTACKVAGLSWQEVDAWSRRGVRYAEREVESRWNGLNLDVSWGAVVNLAKQNGYIPLTKADAAMERLRNRSKGREVSSG